MTVIGEERAIHQRFKFIVEIDGVAHAKFQSCSALEAEYSETTYYEGGAQLPDKQPARLSVSDITLERGAADGDLDMWNWFSETANMAAQGGIPGPGYKRNFDIVQLRRDGVERRRWSVYDAYCKKFTAGAWDNTSDDATIESAVLSANRFDLVYDIGAQQG